MDTQVGFKDRAREILKKSPLDRQSKLRVISNMIIATVLPLIEDQLVVVIVDSAKQAKVKNGLTRVTCVHIDGNEYDVDAIYDPWTGEISES